MIDIENKGSIPKQEEYEGNPIISSPLQWNEIKRNEETSQTIDEVVVPLENNSSLLPPSKENLLMCDFYEHQSFFKGCQWSTDELANRILTCNRNREITIHHTFMNKIDYSSSQISEEKYGMNNIGQIYDYGWYPTVSSDEYYTIAASSLGPLHIYNLKSKKSIASYHMYNLNDEATFAHSIAASIDGSTLIGGTADYLFLFDVNRPGRTFKRILTRPHFKKGIISTISINPRKRSLFAVGSYNHRVGIYDDQTFLCSLYGHSKGVTQVKFSSNGINLLSGCRGANEMIYWDLRNPGTALFKMERVVRTQQRIHFDISPCNRFIVSGSTDGVVYIWDTVQPPNCDLLLPVKKIRVHEDCCNGVSIHPNLPFLVTTSGQYHTAYEEYSDEDENFITNEEKTVIENKLKLWNINFNDI